jgi:paraquat-inducible protein B
MSKQANKTKIGAFVLAAIALAVAGVLIFGSGKLLRDLEKYVLYFEGSVKGLNVGAPVMFRGVKVGSVTDIMLQYNPEDLTIYIPVVIEVERDRFESVSGTKRRKTPTKELIDRGLRAQLQLQSMVTGMLLVDLDFYPDEPLEIVGEERAGYPEIPTVISDLQKLTKAIEGLPLDQIVNKLAKSLDGIEKIVTSPDLQGSIVSLKKALDSADALLVHIDKKVDPLMAQIEDTSDAARGAFVQAEKTLALEEGVPGELASNIKETFASSKDAMASASDALKEAKKTLAAYKGVVAEDSDLIYEVNNAMRELSEAARSIRYFVDYLDRHPESLLRGKKE